MISNSVIKSVRNLRNAVAINVNAARGVEFIPPRGGCLNIETSSLCNLDCVFCAYGKKQSPRLTMKDAFFQACEPGRDAGDVGPLYSAQRL